MANIVIDKNEEIRLREHLNKRGDFEAKRMLRYLSMPDLARTPGSPLNDIVNRILNSEYFKTLDTIEVPEIVPATISFDLFDFAPNHPARSNLTPTTLTTKIFTYPHHCNVVLLFAK